MTTGGEETKANPLLRGSDDDYPWPWHHEEFLRAKLIEQRKSVEELADDWDCSERTIWRSLDQHGLLAEYREARDGGAVEC